MKKIIIKGVREHNLKNIDLELPRDKMIVISGISGSGKSSLAFDTIYAEGQRRYVESLSAYARQFLGRMDKPDVDYIEGLSPAISIEQKTTHRNPRSTVGTVTEIYDYLRLLYARIGKPHCPVCGRPIEEQSVDQIIDAINQMPENSKIMILSPVISGKKGEHKKIIEDARKAGFVRARVDGEVVRLDDTIILDKKRKHSIEVVIDRIKLDNSVKKRIAESVETALEVGNGSLIVVEIDKDMETFFSQLNSCPVCGISIPELQPRLFSFNSPDGACPDCSGLGMTMEFDTEKIIPDTTLSFNEGGFAPYNPKSAWHRSWFEALARHFDFSLDEEIRTLPDPVLESIIHGTQEVISFSYVNREGTGRYEYAAPFQGLIKDLERRYRETSSSGIKEWLESFMTQKTCQSCGGKRLRPESLSVLVGNKNIYEVTTETVKDSLNFFHHLSLNKTELHIAEQILKEINERLEFMVSVGLDYLSLERKASTLSGGEAQRIRLATQIGSSLVGVLYILDEPTIGLHQRDNKRLLDTLKHLRDLGNTLIIVEHDEQTLREADYLVDLGPGAGIHGGNIIAQGTPKQVIANTKSITGGYLKGSKKISYRPFRREGKGEELVVTGACEHNLKEIDVRIPLGTMTCITGVSGSGKSTLITDTLYPAVHNALGGKKRETGNFNKLQGIGFVDKIINIDQSPIGRTPRSNPATYVGLFTPIRELFSGLPESRARGYKPGRFSFNVRGGRCENCQGDGTIKIEMHFLPDVYVTCDVCKGKRFNRETLEIRYKGKTISDVLEMSVEEALDFFSPVPKVARKLRTLHSVGLDYIKLGQSALTLSGGEAQRIKLSLELSKRSTGKTLYLLDEPTTGLHFEDVKKLLDVLQRLVDKGNTVLIIEHNLDVLKQADHIIDLGPEGGDEGGRIVAAGTPEEICNVSDSYTGAHLKPVLEKGD